MPQRGHWRVRRSMPQAGSTIRSRATRPAPVQARLARQPGLRGRMEPGPEATPRAPHPAPPIRQHRWQLIEGSAHQAKAAQTKLQARAGWRCQIEPADRCAVPALAGIAALAGANLPRARCHQSRRSRLSALGRPAAWPARQTQRSPLLKQGKAEQVAINQLLGNLTGCPSLPRAPLSSLSDLSRGAVAAAISLL